MSGNRQTVPDAKSMLMADDGTVLQLSGGDAVSLEPYQRVVNVGAALTANITVTLPPSILAGWTRFVFTCSAADTETITIAAAGTDAIFDTAARAVTWVAPAVGDVLVLDAIPGKGWAVIGHVGFTLT